VPELIGSALDEDEPAIDEDDFKDELETTTCTNDELDAPMLEEPSATADEDETALGAVVELLQETSATDAAIARNA